MALYIGGVAVDATAAEIDVLDGLDRGSIIYGNASSATTVLGQGGADEVLTSDGTDIAWAAAGGASDIGALDDVTMDIANFVDGILIQPNSDGSAPTTGTLSGTTGNVGIGRGSFSALTSGSYNVAMGYQALELNTTGDNNAAFGRYALGVNTTGESNVAIGCNASCANTEGSYNVASGTQALYSNTEGDGNVASGIYALNNNTEGSYNSAVGYAALYSLTTGDNNIGLGQDSGRAISPSGNITTADNTICFGNTSIAAVYVETDAWTTSDIRDKADVADFNGGLDWINAMQPISYVWDKRAWYCEESEDEDGNPIPITPQDILDAEPDGTHKKSSVEVGFSAQAILELEQSLGYGSSNDTSLLVDLTHDGTKYSLKRSHMIPMMVNAIKELSAKVEALENE